MKWITETDEVKITSSYFRKAYNMSLLRSKNDLFISYTSFSSVQNDLYTGTIQKLYNYVEH
jgi:hypothetical protein